MEVAEAIEVAETAKVNEAVKVSKAMKIITEFIRFIDKTQMSQPPKCAATIF